LKQKAAVILISSVSWCGWFLLIDDDVVGLLDGWRVQLAIYRLWSEKSSLNVRSGLIKREIGVDWRSTSSSVKNSLLIAHF
jgi:hypothetical protein